mgnify:CR=1 FL=1
MQTKHKLASGTLLTTLSSLATAHGGHDHSHWLSDPIHILSVIAVIAIAASATYLVKKKKQTQQ